MDFRELKQPLYQTPKTDKFALHLKHPETGDYLYSENGPVVVLLYKMFSETGRSILDNFTRKMKDRNIKRQTADLLTEFTIDIYNATFYGKPFSKEIIKEIYSNDEFAWFHNQVDEAIAKAKI